MKGFCLTALLFGISLATVPKPGYHHGDGYHKPADDSILHGDGYHQQNVHSNSYIHGDGYRKKTHHYKIVTCPKLPSPDYGDVEITGAYPKNTATFSCKSGYVLEGPKVLVCLYNGKWNDDPPTCERIDCGPLPDIPYGKISVKSDTKLGSVATYSCDPKYKLVGNSKRVCKSNGKWYGEEPKCEYYYTPEPPKHPEPKYKKVPCPKLPPLHYGYVKVTGYYENQKATYYCKPGHILVGLPVRKCSVYGKWVGKAPVCKRVDCGPLPNIADGKVSIAPDTRLRSVATYSCLDGFDLKGYATRECQKDGTWSNEEPACERVDCGSLDHPVDGYVQTSPDTRFRSIAIYRCFFGFMLKGAKRRFCSANAQWKPSPPTCEKISCGAPPAASPNGMVSTNGTDLFDTASYSCNTGYFLRGSPKIYCRHDKRWSNTAPTCRPVICGSPDPADPNGSMQAEGITLGSKVQYYCRDGYDLVGESVAKCQANAEWSSDAPTCKPVDCGSLPRPKFGDVFFYPGTTFLSTATFSCGEGLKLVGSKVRECRSNGKWSGVQPVCKKISCPKLAPPTYGKLYVSGYYPKDYAHYECSHGYKLVGKSRLDCLYSGYWSGPPSNCVKDNTYYHSKPYTVHHNKY